MIAELGHFALCMALVVALAQMLLPVAQRLAPAYAPMNLSVPFTTVMFLLVTTSFAALIHSYAVSDFTVLNVILNSHSLKPMIYKITGAWGNHEGSMLLWVWVHSLMGFFIALTRARDAQLKALTLAVHGAVATGFFLFILLTSNPFIRVFPPPLDGEDLNPLLQDIGLAMHPPMLYVGYVGFGIVFAYAIAGMLRGALDSAWAKTVQPWILFTWATLTAGIGLGSWWAYRELGWGGWWFWDPVENVSLLPWLTGAALVHANLVLEKRGALVRWVALLAVLTFSMSLIGTFIVRSGLITSVHSFASDPARGLFILGYIVIVTGIGLGIYARFEAKSAHIAGLLTREGLIVVNNVLLVTAAASILVAILYPVGLTLAELPTISVGPPYFNATVVPLALPLLGLAAIASLLPWGNATPAMLKRALVAGIPIAIIAAIVALALINHVQLLALLAIALTAWLVAATLRYGVRLYKAQGSIARLSLRQMGTFTGHLGLAIFAAGVLATGLFKTVHESPAKAGDDFSFGQFRAHVERIEELPVNNYVARRATVTLYEQGKKLATLTPETRLYPVRGDETTESSISYSLWRDVYAVIGRATYARAETVSDKTIGLRIYIVPGQLWIWLGFALASAGAMLSFIAQIRRGDR